MPYYDNYKGPAQFRLDSKGLGLLLRELRKGNAPPAPYSVGVAENLNIFYFAKKPHRYTRTYTAQGPVG